MEGLFICLWLKQSIIVWEQWRNSAQSVQWARRAAGSRSSCAHLGTAGGDCPRPRWAPAPRLGPRVVEQLRWVKLIILNRKKRWKIPWNWTLYQLPVLQLGSWSLGLYSSLGTKGSVKPHYRLEGLLTTALPVVLQECWVSLNVLTNVHLYPCSVFWMVDIYFPTHYEEGLLKKMKFVSFSFIGNLLLSFSCSFCFHR